MADKFEDLTDAVGENIDTSDHGVRTGIEWTLEWLDEHPDQVPGRTITQSRYASEKKDRSLTYMQGFHSAMVEFGGAVVPDPEPTDSQQMFVDLEGMTGDGFLLQGRHLEKIAKYLTDLGWTKAPGGDNGTV
ncbi:hypothetical protein SEA_LUCKYBARNES_52 [Brevibacterium phage LuckyBarnes]|uniref:Uncharacterized protein n=1 Tax=Brevibacterium phage LuckyBarnes TaxID=2027888 RepID=A0A249XNQ5_9CAUD|nr:hypothetical protein HOS02_gp52 [Brevibacterium phage LuckyBarnes]ASZ73369.1 hypothetical protein SEA_LUCKYBARNES_52 [Brevibacterium phage LuckyBarnes]